MHRRFTTAALWLALSIPLACTGDSGTEPPPDTAIPSAIRKTGGDGQIGVVGSQLGRLLTVRVTDQKGRAMNGVSVAWSVHAGGGALGASTTTSNSSGSAAVAWTLGHTAGENGATATVGDLSPVTFTAIGHPDRPSLLIKHGGDGQTGPAHEALADSLAVKVTDSFGNVVSGVRVSFTPRSGSGSVRPAAPVTNKDGLAKTQWTLDASAGTDSVDATFTGRTGDPVHFVAMATPNGTITGSLTLTSESQALVAALRTARMIVGPARSLGRTRLASAGLGRDRSGGIGGPAEAMLRGAGASGRPGYVPGSLVITYRSGAVRAPPAGARAYGSMTTARAVADRIRTRAAAQAATHRFQVRGVSPAILAARIRVPPERLEEVRALLLQDPAVAAVEREHLLYTTERQPAAVRAPVATGTVPNDPLYRPQMWHYSAIDLPAAWGITTGSSSVLVAVVDDGIRFDHPSVAANLTADGYDFVSQDLVGICGITVDNAGDGDGYDSDPTIPASYGESTCGLSTSGGHGLHVAGTIGAAGNDGYGVTGVNWSVRVRPVRVLGIGGFGSDYDVAQGILYAAGLPADDGAGGPVQAPSAADIVNLSLGGPIHSTGLQHAVQAAANAGALLVAAAGNDGVSTRFYPAAYPEVLAVAAIGPDYQLASYSNFGSTIDIAAPGGDQADGDASHGVASAEWNFRDSQPTHNFRNGTSMAAPHVTGVAALLLARTPSLTADQLRARLLDHAVDLGPAGWDQQYGHGLVNARNSLTRTHGPSGLLHARLYDAKMGTILRSVVAGTGGTYTFSALADGPYYVFAGMDHDGDQQVGIPGRPWGAYGSATVAPSAVTVSGAGIYRASFSVGWPNESEPNNVPAEADRLVLGGYVHGTFGASTDVDVYRITVPAGHYTFETSGRLGSCGHANEADTILELYDGNGPLIASNDDLDAAALNYCSGITQTLPAGTYELRVKYGSGGGHYRLEARTGA